MRCGFSRGALAQIFVFERILKRRISRHFTEYQVNTCVSKMHDAEKPNNPLENKDLWQSASRKARSVAERLSKTQISSTDPLENRDLIHQRISQTRILSTKQGSHPF